MGQEYSTGIKVYGTPIIKNCLKCNALFTTYVGRVTIKGNVHEDSQCIACRKEEEKKEFDRIERLAAMERQRLRLNYDKATPCGPTMGRLEELH